MDYIKVEGHDGLVRDKNTGAIINLDNSAIIARRKSKQLSSALEDINTLKNEVSELKFLLRELTKMPAIQVAKTDTFELQRQKINDIGTQIFNISQGGSDLSTGNLKIGDGTIAAPSLSFTSDASVGIYKPSAGSLGFVSSNKKFQIYNQQMLSSIKM